MIQKPPTIFDYTYDDLTRDLVAPMVDHTLLKPEASREEVILVVEDSDASVGERAVAVSSSTVRRRLGHVLDQRLEDR